MATKTSDLLTAAAPETVAVVRGISDDQLDRPTPCQEYAVRDLLGHLFQVVVNFQGLAARRPVDWSEQPDFLTGDWRDRFAVETGRVIGAWSEPSALKGVSPGMGMPQEVVGGMLLLDLTVHGWDLARSTGQPYRADPAVVAELLDLAARLAPTARERGVFGAVVEPADTGDDLDRLLCLTGRDPAWPSAG
ncbi:TIGR03086 family protein [Micromonospora echinospora]|uniref:TIGR03086 family protein n=1 Tax=Micromonospora echinospora TaxID=1877 RepID=A0A1C4VY36_MICEC|nr:TIGR03086 family metal-binding protein [Micromonospora echinospora]OZV80210.1 TIGR03086 family protein [Micromonospora echinospora]SCE88755.1 TIGR03086 family protein [Micromonospora echinospora]